MKRDTATSVDAYIAEFPSEVRELLRQVRATIKAAAPDAEETIKYAIPTFTFHGNLVHFAAFNRHIGFYPAPSGGEAFRKELSVYKSGKGSIQFPLDRPVPLDLIQRIVKYRLNENLEKSKSKKK